MNKLLVIAALCAVILSGCKRVEDSTAPTSAAKNVATPTTPSVLVHKSENTWGGEMEIRRYPAVGITCVYTKYNDIAVSCVASP